MDGMIALRASTILNIVMEGAKNPLYEWEKRFEQKFPWKAARNTAQKCSQLRAE